MDNYQKFGIFAIVISIPFTVASFFNQGQGVIFAIGILYGLIFIFHSRIEKDIISKIKKPLVFYGVFVFLSGMFIESLAYFNNLVKIKAGQDVFLFSPDLITDLFIKGLPHYILIAIFLSLLVRKYYFSVFELGFILWLFWAVVVDNFSHLQALLTGNILDFTMAGLLMVFGLHWPILVFRDSLDEAYPKRSRHWFKYPAAFISLILSVVVLTVLVFLIEEKIGLVNSGR